jgi:carbon storage regulator
MLVLSRKVRESIVIGGSVRVTVSSIDGSRVRIAVEAPVGVSIYRQELLDRAGGEFTQTVADRALFGASDGGGDSGGLKNPAIGGDGAVIGGAIRDKGLRLGAGAGGEQSVAPIRMVLAGERRLRREG